MKTSRYIISKLGDDINYRLVSKNGKTILTSKSCKDVSTVLQEIKKTQQYGSDMRNFNFLFTKNNEMYFTLTKFDEIIAKSNTYKTEYGLIKGCNSVMDNCQTTTIQYIIDNEPLPKMKPITKELKTSAEWYPIIQDELKKNENRQLIIYDPDGWDRSNYQYSWYEEKITRREFTHRLQQSTCMIKKI